MFIDSIDKRFWFYPADCIIKKAHEIEKFGLELYELIKKQSAFEKEFFLDAAIEEAITSAIYEGANSTRAKEFIEAGAVPKSKDDWMLMNNYNAMLWIKENRERNVSLNLIKEVHEIVTRNTLTKDELNFSGKFRDDKVFVFSGADMKHEGVDFKKIESSLLLHYFISYVHPFFDGNGRTARTLFYYKAIRNKLNFVEILSVSAYLKNHGKQYEKSFEKVVENDFDITYFIDFNLDSLKAA